MHVLAFFMALVFMNFCESKLNSVLNVLLL